MHQFKIFRAVIMGFLLIFMILPALSAAPSTFERATDSHHDGKIDTWTTYDAKGDVMVIAMDTKRKDGKPDYWKYYRKGKIYKREWDRNFDGKPDLRVLEVNGRVIETQYDNNFDNKFEKVIKAPKIGSVISVKTTNESQK